jgi:alginate O-acetyltransferase complex protein AlgI
MLFNSVDFAIFLPIVFAIYWILPTNYLRIQNAWLLFCSYLFYAWWDWRFLGLIVFSTFIDFFVGKRLNETSSSIGRKRLLFLSIGVNIGFLGFFKYFNFFIDNFVKVFSFFGTDFSINTLNIVLPVGISFYTFQTMSYTIDVYQKKLKPTKDFIAFGAFVSFFPQLVAGPIERATHLLPQFFQRRKFDYDLAVDGLRQILWGLFKKMVIADNCAVHANEIFNNSGNYNGSTLFLGGLFFAFQIYGDFSGYSDIAIGTSRLFGFDLKRNFAFPYFSRDMAEFWRRWHISLSTWFRDYLYIPLGGSQGGTAMKIRNTFIIFIISGFWHGANWTFIIWGALNAIFFIPLLLGKTNRKHLEIVASGKILPTFSEAMRILGTFALTVFAWIFFRAENVSHAFSFIAEVLSPSLFEWPDFNGAAAASVTGLLILCFLVLEWLGKERQYAIQQFGLNWWRPFRFLFYNVIVISIFWFGGKEQAFIYFQF